MDLEATTDTFQLQGTRIFAEVQGFPEISSFFFFLNLVNEVLHHLCSVGCVHHNVVKQQKKKFFFGCKVNKITTRTCQNFLVLKIVPKKVGVAGRYLYFFSRFRFASSHLNDWLKSVNHLSVVTSTPLHAEQFLRTLTESQPTFRGLIAKIREECKKERNLNGINNVPTQVQIQSAVSATGNDSMKLPRSSSKQEKKSKRLKKKDKKSRKENKKRRHHERKKKRAKRKKRSKKKSSRKRRSRYGETDEEETLLPTEDEPSVDLSNNDEEVWMSGDETDETSQSVELMSDRDDPDMDEFQTISTTTTITRSGRKSIKRTKKRNYSMMNQEMTDFNSYPKPNPSRKRRRSFYNPNTYLINSTGKITHLETPMEYKLISRETTKISLRQTRNPIEEAIKTSVGSKTFKINELHKALEKIENKSLKCNKDILNTLAGYLLIIDGVYNVTNTPNSTKDIDREYNCNDFLKKMKDINPDDDKCSICHKLGNLICCDGCPQTFHQECLRLQEIPRGKFFCSDCEQKGFKNSGLVFVQHVQI